MSGPLIRPTEKKRLNEGMAACARCIDRIEAIKALGLDRDEMAKRAEAAHQLISGILALDAQAQASK